MVAIIFRVLITRSIGISPNSFNLDKCLTVLPKGLIIFLNLFAFLTTFLFNIFSMKNFPINPNVSNVCFKISVGIPPISLNVLSVFVNLCNTRTIVLIAIEPNVIGAIRGPAAATPRPRVIIDFVMFITSFILSCFADFVIMSTVFVNFLIAVVINKIAIDPIIIGIDSGPIAATPRPRDMIEPVSVITSFIFIFFVDFDIIESDFAKGINAIPITAIDTEPINMNGATAGIPNIAITPPNNTVSVAITPICLKLTSFVALVILPSPIPNKTKDVLITNITREPINTFFFALASILNVKEHIVTIPTIRIEPNIAGPPVNAIVARNTEDTAIRPVNAVNIIADPIALFISLLLFDSFLAIGIVLSTIFAKSFAPNIAGPAVTTAIVKNIDVTNRLPIRVVVFFAIFTPSFISFLFFLSFLDIDNIEFFAPNNISLNFLTVSFLIIKFTSKPILNNAFTISGEALINLIILSRVFFFIFKFSSAFLNIFDNIFIFCFPIIISFNEMSLSFVNASIIEVNPLPLFCFFILFIISFATISEALSPNFATAGIGFIPLFLKDFERLSIAFLMLFVSSRISFICLLFIFDELPLISIDFFFVGTSTSSCKRIFISFTIL